MNSTKLTNEAASSVLELGKLLMQFGRVKKSTYHEDGQTVESDTDHTVMTAVIACAFAERFLPELDAGKIAKFALVHDLVEVYAGDTPTFKKMSETEKKAKENRERTSLKRIVKQFGQELPWIHQTIKAYEAQRTAEARYVKAMDKLMPKITHILNSGVSIKEKGYSKPEAMGIYEEQHDKMQKEYGNDFAEVMQLVKILNSKIFKSVSF